MAIAGRPNVGKSSLLNAFLQTDRAIVTPYPGTTRDILEEWVNIRGMAVKAMDMAGLHGTQDLIEQEGIRRARQAIDRADLVLLVIDASQPLQEEDRCLMEMVRAKRKIVVLNKSDLAEQVREYGRECKIEQEIKRDLNGAPVVRTVATRQLGLGELREKVWEQVLSESFRAGSGGFGEGSCPISSRHKPALEKAAKATERALVMLGRGTPGEFLALELKTAMDHLGEIIGNATTEDLLDQIFSRFCIGK